MLHNTMDMDELVSTSIIHGEPSRYMVKWILWYDNRLGLTGTIGNGKTVFFLSAVFYLGKVKRNTVNI